MQTPDSIFNPLVGQLVWSVRRGHGSFLTFEFGRSHLAVREPIKAKSRNAKIRAGLERRRVFCEGQWGLWVTYSYWKIAAEDKSCDHEDEHSKVDEVLTIIDGQKLLGAKFSPKNKMLTMRFDLGGSVQIWLPENPEDHGNDMWMLRNNERGYILTCLNDGELDRSKVQRFKAGSITEIELAKAKA
jgi:hypothetical protein